MNNQTRPAPTKTTATPCAPKCAVHVPSTNPHTMLTTWVCKRCGK